MSWIRSWAKDLHRSGLLWSILNNNTYKGVRKAEHRGGKRWTSVLFQRRPQSSPHSFLELERPLRFDVNWNKELGLCAPPTTHILLSFPHPSIGCRKYTGPRLCSRKNFLEKESAVNPQQPIFLVPGEIRVLVLNAGAEEYTTASTTGVDDRGYGCAKPSPFLNLEKSFALPLTKTPEFKYKFVKMKEF